MITLRLLKGAVPVIESQSKMAPVITRIFAINTVHIYFTCAKQ